MHPPGALDMIIIFFFIDRSLWFSSGKCSDSAIVHHKVCPWASALHAGLALHVLALPVKENTESFAEAVACVGIVCHFPNGSYITDWNTREVGT